MRYLCISITFLDPLYHGKGDDGPEWPPSPLRLYQSLLAGVRIGCNYRMWSNAKVEAFHWLEKHNPPEIIAPVVVSSTSPSVYFVPNNDGDKKFYRQDRLTSKVFQPHRLLDEEQSSLHYLWALTDPLTDDVSNHIETLLKSARSVVALGWGIDMVVGYGSIISDEDANVLPGERWLPKGGVKGNGLRVPVQGTLVDLIQQHDRFLNRLNSDELIRPPRLSAFKTIMYRRATDPPIRPIASFSFLKPDASGFLAFDPVRRGLKVIGMVRHTAKITAAHAGWPEQRINEFVLGHGEPNDGSKHIAVGPKRFVYLPLPSIETRGGGKKRVVGSVRRVILSTFADTPGNEISWARRSLPGQELIDEVEEKPVALLSGPLPKSDKIVQYYTKPAPSWTTVTPVVLPGYDDPAHYRRRLKNGTTAEEQKRLLEHLSNRIDSLLRKAIVQAGFSQTLADHAEIEWRKIGFLPGVEHADRYGIPDHLKRYPRYHVRLCWHDPKGNLVNVPGPISIGGGRFFGLGLFVREWNSAKHNPVLQTGIK